MNFENLTVRFYVIYVLNTHVKFHFKLDIIYYSINKLIFLYIILYYKILKFKYLIDDISIDFLFS